MKEKLKKHKKSICTITLLVLGAIIFVFGIPLIINELYKVNAGYVTLWDASDVLSFYAVILSGIISIGILLVTIRYNAKETARQINFTLSQLNVPFFIVDNIITKDNERISLQPHNTSKLLTYTINKPGNNILIFQLKNIGDGLGISPACKIQVLGCTPQGYASTLNQLPLYVQRDGTLEISYDVLCFLPQDAIEHGFSPIQATIVLTYKNTFGIAYSQNITLRIEKKPNVPRTITILITMLSYQSIISL